MLGLLTIQEVVDEVFSIINKDQNTLYPPSAIEAHINLVSDIILSEGARVYPTNQSLVEVLRPFLRKKMVAVKNGGILDLPTDFRHMLSVAVASSDSYTKPCNCCNEEHGDDNGCDFRNVDFVSDDKFDLALSASYRKPSFKNPIAKYLDGRTIKICPNDVVSVEIRYLKHPSKYSIGYKIMCDDTWQIDTSKSNHKDLEWERNASHKIVMGMVKLYSMYSSDRDLQQAASEIVKMGIF